MNEVYAVDPTAPADAGELVQLVRLFGPAEGRFLYDVPYQWRVQALKHIAGESDVMKQRAMTVMHRYRSAFVQPRRSPLPRASWIETACTLQPLKALIGPRGCPPTAVAIDAVLFDVDALPDSRGEHVARTPLRLRSAAEMLLRISPRIVLVDPYLRLSYVDRSGSRRDDRRFRPVLLELLRAAACERTAIFEIFVSRASFEGESDSEFAGRLERLKTEAGADALELNYGVLEEDTASLPGGRQHARYLLGVASGLQFDHGFDSSDDGSLNHVHWLSESELRPLLARFQLPDF